MIEIPLADLGLLTVADAAAQRGVDVRTVQRWIANCWLPAAVVQASGPHPRVYLIRERDLAKFAPPKRGPVPVQSEQRPARVKRGT